VRNLVVSLVQARVHFPAAVQRLSAERAISGGGVPWMGCHCHHVWLTKFLHTSHEGLLNCSMFESDQSEALRKGKVGAPGAGVPDGSRDSESVANTQ
jgi:hypothetical protein